MKQKTKLLLGSWIFYFTFYFATERLIPASACHVIHSKLDDMIPFCEYFAVFYILWYFLVFGVLAYYYFRDEKQFIKLQSFILVTQVVAMIVYILYPSVQNMRPETFVNTNIFTQLLQVIYTVDTSTGVCPSLHVGYSLALLSVVSKDEKVSKYLKALLTITVFMICISVCFVKQHSVIDVMAAIPMCMLAEALVYGKVYRNRLNGLRYAVLARKRKKDKRIWIQ